MNYNNKKFRTVQTTDNGETSEETLFEYKQEGNILTANYSGGFIIKGQLIGLVDDKGQIDMRYHQVNIHGEIMTGICYSRPEIMDNRKIRLLEKWQWTSGKQSTGESILEEV